MILKYSVGLDMASKKMDACISVIDVNQNVIVKSTKKSIPNTNAGFKELTLWIEHHHKEKNIPLVVCVEATGVYHENCAFYLHDKKHKLSIVLPNKANKYLQSIGLKSKNDTIDAKGLAQMGAEQNLKLWQPAGKYYYDLRTYTRQHQSIQETKTVFNNQLHALEFAMYPNKKVLKQLQNSLKLLDKQLKEIRMIIEKHISNDKEVVKKVANICQIKGISTLTVATIIAETNGFELFENYKQLVSYSGYDVIENQSGKKAGRTKISKRGNSRIRRALFMPAFSVVTHQQKPFIDLYNRTFEKHGISMKSYVAVQKKILIIIYSLWKNDKSFDLNYKTNSLVNNHEAKQDNHQKDNFPNSLQKYDIQTNNETEKQTKKIHSNSQNKQQSRRNSKMCEIPI